MRQPLVLAQEEVIAAQTVLGSGGRIALEMIGKAQDIAACRAAALAKVERIPF